MQFTHMYKEVKDGVGLAPKAPLKKEFWFKRGF